MKYQKKKKENLEDKIEVEEEDDEEEKKEKLRKKLISKAKKNGGSTSTAKKILEKYFELKESESKTRYTSKIMDKDIFNWQVKLYFKDIKKQCKELFEDLQQYKKNVNKGQDYVLLEVKFNDSFPKTPPFIRVITPRFQFQKGHITIGGSICMELLTTSGWLPDYTFEAILTLIRLEIAEGGGRLDFSNTSQYNENDAKDAFNRMVEKYGFNQKK